MFKKKAKKELSTGERLLKAGVSVRAVIGPKGEDVLVEFPKLAMWMTLEEAKELRQWLTQSIRAIEDFTP